MARELVPHNRPIFDELHPNIYKAAVGLVALFALAAWTLFDRQNDTGLPLAMVTVLLLVAVLLPSLSWSGEGTGRRIKEIRTRSHFTTGELAISRCGAASFAARTRRSTCCCRWRRLHSASWG